MAEYNGLVLFIHLMVIGKSAGQDIVTLHQFQHGPIECSQKTITQKAIGRKAPLTPCMGITPTIPLSRKIDPLGMSKFVTHKIEIGLPGQRDRKESDHLVQRHTPIDNQVFRRTIHIRVHLLIHQSEGNGFISHQSLIM